MVSLESGLVNGHVPTPTYGDLSLFGEQPAVEHHRAAGGAEDDVLERRFRADPAALAQTRQREAGDRRRLRAAGRGEVCY